MNYLAVRTASTAMAPPRTGSARGAASGEIDHALRSHLLAVADPGGEFEHFARAIGMRTAAMSDGHRAFHDQQPGVKLMCVVGIDLPGGAAAFDGLVSVAA